MTYRLTISPLLAATIVLLALLMVGDRWTVAWVEFVAGPVIVPCTTDADCQMKNPHIREF